jgi:hypothetical protein
MPRPQDVSLKEFLRLELSDKGIISLAFDVHCYISSHTLPPPKCIPIYIMPSNLKQRLFQTYP